MELIILFIASLGFLFAAATAESYVKEKYPNRVLLFDVGMAIVVVGLFTTIILTLG